MLARHPRPAWAVFFEVPCLKGFAASTQRYADAIAVGLWPSVGHEIIGFEFKSSRGDWRRELKQPEKSLSIMKYCHRWWLVAESPKVFEVEELPATWGALQWTGKVLKVVRRAPPLAPEVPPMGFIASLLARSQEGMIHEGEIQEKILEAGHSARQSQSWELKRALSDLAKLQENVERFNRETGIDLEYDWKVNDSIEAIKLVQKHGASSVERAVENLDLLKALDRLLVSAKHVTEACAELEAKGPSKVNVVGDVPVTGTISDR